MHPETTFDQQKLASEYLDSVQSLSEELARATAAIARNDLASLERHIESQQRLCTQLLSLAQSSHGAKLNSAGKVPLRVALRKLNRNNRVYSSLLAASGRSHRVMLTLCKAYKDSSSHSDANNQVARKLSCEV